MRGAYLVVIECQTHIEITVGAQGDLSFKEGVYIYVGSAMGAKGSTTLLNRVRRHIKAKEQKSAHWHIDYFLNSEHTKIIQLYLIPSKERIECLLASGLAQTAEHIIPKFGCSDCDCTGHLFYYTSKKGLPSYL
jgi:Uri superfamily endonuclease